MWKSRPEMLQSIGPITVPVFVFVLRMVNLEVGGGLLRAQRQPQLCCHFQRAFQYFSILPFQKKYVVHLYKCSYSYEQVWR